MRLSGGNLLQTSPAHRNPTIMKFSAIVALAFALGVTAVPVPETTRIIITYPGGAVTRTYTFPGATTRPVTPPILTVPT